MTRVVVYVAGPIGEDAGRLGRAFAAMHVEADLVARGFAPILPHHYVVTDALHPTPRAALLEVGLALLRKSDAMYRLIGVSPGADAEEVEARRLGIPCFRNLESLLDWRDSRVDPLATVEALRRNIREYSSGWCPRPHVEPIRDTPPQRFEIRCGPDTDAVLDSRVSPPVRPAQDPGFSPLPCSSPRGADPVGTCPPAGSASSFP